MKQQSRVGLGVLHHRFMSRIASSLSGTRSKLDRKETPMLRKMVVALTGTAMVETAKLVSVKHA